MKTFCIIPFKNKLSLTVASLLLFITAFGQKGPTINIRYSKLLATYDFVQKLSGSYPDNESKLAFQSSGFYTQHHTNLLKQFDSLNIYESYEFQNYPTGQKTPVTTTSLIEKYLISSTSMEDFKSRAFGIIPNAELFSFTQVLSEFITVYDSLVYTPNRIRFENQLAELKTFVQNSNLSLLFQEGLTFYGSQWDTAIPIDIAVIPSLSKRGFTARAFLNNAVTEAPLSFRENDILFSVLMHEIYHNIYDGQSLGLKLKIQDWFNSNSSKNSQYAYLLLNEALATALGNGYVYEKLNGKTDHSDWYNVKYINLMAKEIYPLVREYLAENKPIDKAFVDRYIASYDKNFPGWTNEADNLFAYRFVITDDPSDLRYLRNSYRQTSFYKAQIPLSQAALEKMRETPVTKVIIISSDNKNKLRLVKSTFPELRNWNFNAEKEFVYTADLQDRTKLIVVNRYNSSLEKLFGEK